MRTVLFAGALLLAGCAASTQAPDGSDVPVENCDFVKSLPALSPGDWHSMANKKADAAGQNAAITWRDFQDYIVVNCPELAPAVGR